MEILVSPANSCNDDISTADFCSPICGILDLCFVDGGTPECGEFTVA